MNIYRVMEPTEVRRLPRLPVAYEFRSRHYETRLGMIRVEKAWREAAKNGTLCSKGWYDNSEGEE
jgi:hypothetical protein